MANLHIRELREAAGYTQAELAKGVGVTSDLSSGLALDIGQVARAALHVQGVHGHTQTLCRLPAGQ